MADVTKEEVNAAVQGFLEGLFERFREEKAREPHIILKTIRMSETSPASEEYLQAFGPFLNAFLAQVAVERMQAQDLIDLDPPMPTYRLVHHFETEETN